MRLLLIRHGISAATSLSPRGSDFDRPITEQGAILISKLATQTLTSFIPASCSNIKLYSSPFLRTKQTSEIIARELPLEKSNHPLVTFEDRIQLGANKEQLEEFLTEITSQDIPSIVVSHEPELCFMLSRLTGISESALFFDRGGVAVIDTNTRSPIMKGTLMALIPSNIYL